MQRQDTNSGSRVTIPVPRVVPELEILTILPDLTLNFVALIGRPQCNSRYCWQASLLQSPAAEF